MTQVEPFPRKEILDRIGNILPSVDSVLAIQGRYRHLRSFSTPISCRATECTYNDGGIGGGPPVPTYYVALAESDEPFLFDWEREVYHKKEGPGEELRGPGIITPRFRQVYIDFVSRNHQAGRKYGMMLGVAQGSPSHVYYGIWLTDSMVFGKHTNVEPFPTTQVYYESLGNSTGSAPLESAVWKGQMIGASLQANPVQGDATLTFDFGSTTLDILFHNVHNLATGGAFRDMSWSDVSVDSTGKFSANHGESGSLGPNRGSLEGRFYGENHAEVGGVFNTIPFFEDPIISGRNVGVKGAFAAIKQ